MSQPTTIKRTSIKFTYVAHPHNSPVFEFYERPDHVRSDEEEEEGNDSNSDDEVDKEESDRSMVVDSMEEEDSTSSKDKGKGRAVDHPTSSGSSRVKSKLRDNTRDLNGRQPIIILRTGEGWNWSVSEISFFLSHPHELSLPRLTEIYPQWCRRML
jgi:hypothetical protein